MNYKGVDSRLVPAELSFKEIVAVKRIDMKAHAMQTIDTFRENAAQLNLNFQLLSRACRQVQKSEKLQDVLEMVLHVGNILNEGTRTGGASGFNCCERKATYSFFWETIFLIVKPPVAY